MESLILHHWTDGSSGGDSEHGTKVASRVAFKNVFIKRIQNAVAAFCGVSKICNLSANSSSPIEGDELS